MRTPLVERAGGEKGKPPPPGRHTRRNARRKRENREMVVYAVEGMDRWRARKMIRRWEERSRGRRYMRVLTGVGCEWGDKNLVRKVWRRLCDECGVGRGRVRAISE